MNSLREFSELIKQKIKEGVPVQNALGVVKEVDWEAKTCTVVGLVDDLEYYNVLLGFDVHYTHPEVGAKVLIGLVHNSSHSFLIWTEKAQEVNYTVGESKLLIKDNGFAVQVGNESLKACLNDMIDELNKIIVIVGTTINVPAMTAIKQRLNTVLIE